MQLNTPFTFWLRLCVLPRTEPHCAKVQRQNETESGNQQSARFLRMSMIYHNGECLYKTANYTAVHSFVIVTAPPTWKLWHTALTDWLSKV